MAAQSQAQLRLLVSLRDEASRGLHGMAGTLGDIAKTAAGFAIGGLFHQGINAAGRAFSGMWNDAIEGAAEAAAVAREQAQVLEATGGAAGMTSDELNNLATSLSRATGMGDDFIASGNNMLLTFKNIGEDVFPRASAAMLDYAQFMGVDARSAATALGKALNDPTTGLTALSRAGVTFTAQQVEQIKAMQKAGDMAGAQAIILGELESQFGGAAEAAATNGSKLSNAWGELLEMAGGVALGIRENLAGVALPLVMGLMERLEPVVASVSSIFGEFFARLQTGEDPIGAVANLLYYLPQAFGVSEESAGRFFDVFITVARFLQDEVPRAFQFVKDAFTTFQQALSGDWADSGVIQPLHRVIGVIGQVAAAFGEGGLGAALDVVLPYLQAGFETLVAWLGEQVPVVQATLLGWASAFVGWIGEAWPLLLGGLAGLLLPPLIGWIEAQGPTIMASLQAWAAAFVAWVVPATQQFLAAWPGMLDSFLTWIAGAAGPILSQLGQWTISFVGWVVSMIPEFTLALVGIVAAMSAWITATKPVLAEHLLEWVTAFLEWVGALIERIDDELAKIVDEITAWITTTGVGLLRAQGERIGDAIRGGIESAIAGIVGWFKGQINELIDLANGFINTYNSSNGPLPDVNTIPRLATGTQNFRGGYAIVGEQGPEIVHIPRGSNVYTNRESQQMAGGNTAHFHAGSIVVQGGSRREVDLGIRDALASAGLTIT